MTFQPGAIYSTWNPKINAYTAYQFTHLIPAKDSKSQDSYAILQLNWSGPTLPPIDELANAEPFVFDFYFWDKQYEHVICPAPVPKSYTYIGQLPLLETEIPKSYGSWTPNDRLERQRDWDLIPAEKRAAFYAAVYHHNNQEVVICDQTFRIRNNRLFLESLPDLTDYNELDLLPCLTNLRADRWNKKLEQYINNHYFIYDLELHCQENNLQSAHPNEQIAQAYDITNGIIDLSSSRITNLAIDSALFSVIHKVILPLNLRQLSVFNMSEATPRAFFVHPYEGKDCTLMLSGKESIRLDAIQGLDHMSELYLNNITELDLSFVVTAFPKLDTLRIWGNMGMLYHTDQIEKLDELTMLTITEMFGFLGSEFPPPAKLPKLDTLWLTSVPAEAAASIKQAYKHEKKKGFDLDVRQPRKPEWIADNVDNPFRTWDGRTGITAAQAQKAAALYKNFASKLRALQARTDVTVSTQNEQTGESVEQQLIDMLCTYIEGFNKLDKRKVFIYTEEREDIITAVSPLVSRYATELKNNGIYINENRIWEITDELRDF